MQQSSTIVSKKTTAIRTDVPFWKQLVAGGGAGIAEILLMYPTDVMKTRAQVVSKRTPIVETFVNILRTEGLGTFYRGITSPIVAEAPKRAVKFSCNERYKSLFVNPTTNTMSNFGAVAAGSLAGVTEAFVNCPFEVIKVRMQTDAVAYATTFRCLTQILRSDKPLANLYKGIESHVWRNATWNGAYFGLIGTLRNLYPTTNLVTDNQKTLHTLAIGTFAGGFASCLSTPFDVVKSRMQQQQQLRQLSGGFHYRYTIPSLVHIAMHESPANLYKGLYLRLLRLAPGGGVMVLVFDRITEFLQDF
uniref:Mitochondrial 2-oxodicarboxylate carrier n=4 Tax=Lygus hesperus TaxID=30085 RepID=A0A146L4B6_LYGHE